MVQTFRMIDRDKWMVICTDRSDLGSRSLVKSDGSYEIVAERKNPTKQTQLQSRGERHSQFTRLLVLLLVPLPSPPSFLSLLFSNFCLFFSYHLVRLHSPIFQIFF